MIYLSADAAVYELIMLELSNKNTNDSVVVIWEMGSYGYGKIIRPAVEFYFEFCLESIWTNRTLYPSEKL